MDQPTVDKALADIKQMVSDSFDMSSVTPERVDAAMIVSASEKQSIGLKQALDFRDVDASDAILRNSIPVKSAVVSQEPDDEIKLSQTKLRWRLEE